MEDINYKIYTSYTVNGLNYYGIEGFHTEHFDIVPSFQGGILKLVLYPKTTLKNVNFSVFIEKDYSLTDKIFCNGFQSSSKSREYSIRENMSDAIPNKMLLPMFSFIKDSRFINPFKKEGYFNSISYSYVKNIDTSLELIGSMSENFGFTIIRYEIKNNLIKIKKDLDGVTISNSYEILDICFLEGKYEEVFDKYFMILKTSSPVYRNIFGYSTGINTSNLTQQDIIASIQSFRKENINLDYFVLDHGYEKDIGDWFLQNKNITSLNSISSEIHNAGFRAGLWLAPFCCSQTSYIYKSHPDWVLKVNGKPFSPLYYEGKPIYVLNINNEKVCNHIKEFLNVLNQVYGFDMYKLDLLYTICLIPQNNKSRGQIMCEAINLIERICGGKVCLMGCEVPVMPAFGKLDICRVTSTSPKQWNNTKSKKYFDFNNVTHETFINSAVFRRHLNGRAFINDIDNAFISQKDNNFSYDERKLKTLLNKVLSSSIFISNTIDELDNEQKETLHTLFNDDDVYVLNAECLAKDILFIEYKINGIKDSICFNIITGQKI